jgi:transposase
MDTNTVERSIRPHTLLRKNVLFAGSDGGARHWSLAMTLIQTAKLNGVDPMPWLTGVLERTARGRSPAASEAGQMAAPHLCVVRS